MSAQAKHRPTIVFQFQGGIRDGQVVRSDQSPEDREEAHELWALTWGGMVGRRFDVPSPNMPVRQRYQVSGKCEYDEEVHVTCQFVAET
jgi:hypothetical protein